MRTFIVVAALLLSATGCQFLGDQDMIMRADFSIIHGTEDEKETDE